MLKVFDSGNDDWLASYHQPSTVHQACACHAESTGGKPSSGEYLEIFSKWKENPL